MQRDVAGGVVGPDTHQDSELREARCAPGPESLRVDLDGGVVLGAGNELHLGFTCGAGNELHTEESICLLISHRVLVQKPASQGWVSWRLDSAAGLAQPQNSGLRLCVDGLKLRADGLQLGWRPRRRKV